MKETNLILASIGTALGATVCCVGPFAAVVFGVGSLAAASSWEPLRPYFLAGTLLLFGGALRAPAFELPDMAGHNVRLADFEGKVVLLDLWATWCTPCLEGIPFYNTLLDRYGGKGLEIVGIAVQSDYDAIQPIIDKYGIRYPVLVGNRGIESAYHLIGFPTAFLIGRDGGIRRRLLGTTQVEGIEGEIRTLLGLE